MSAAVVGLVFLGLFAGMGLAVCAAEGIARWLWSPRRVAFGEYAARRRAAMERHPAGRRAWQ